MTDLGRARELLDEAEATVPVVGLAHAKVALDTAIDGGRDPALAAERECGLPCACAGRKLREARQVLAGVQEVSAGGA